MERISATASFASLTYLPIQGDKGCRKFETVTKDLYAKCSIIPMKKKFLQEEATRGSGTSLRCSATYTFPAEGGKFPHLIAFL
jgi:hypothetical protein